MNQDEKLQLLNQTLEQCRNCEFYKARIPDVPLSSLDDLKYLPFTTKEDLRENSPFGLICVPRKELYQYHETFGTTGAPASTWLTKEDFLDLAHRVNEGGINFNEEDIVLIRFPYAISTVAHFMHAAAQLKNACVIPASSRNTVTPYRRIIDLLGRLEVSVLACLPMQAILLAETAEIMELKPNKDFPKLRAVYTAGEAMTPGKRKLIESMWGVPIIDNYGSTEVGPTVLDCEYGVPHLLEDYFVFELLDDDLKSEVGLGEIGNLVVTTLTRKATPLIRYLTGDRARLVEKECKCGKKFAIEVRGRKQDVITIGDRMFDIWDIDEIVSQFPCHRFWAVAPNKDRLKFVVEGEDFSREQIKDIEAKYNIGLDIEVVPEGVLCDRSELLSIGSAGKPKYVYSEEEMEHETYLGFTKI